MRMRIAILMYHGILDAFTGRLTHWSDRHTIKYGAFYSQLSLIHAERWRTLFSEDFDNAVRDRASRQLAITFDDGHSSDIRAAEVLANYQLKATFFITWNQLGRPDFLTHSDVLALASRGFRIGSHALNHTPMSALDDRTLWRELSESKQRLEDLIGAPVSDFACPFGAYDWRLIACAHAIGYRTVMTSNIGRAALSGESVLPRLAVLNDTSFDDFRAMLSEGVFMTARRWLRCGFARRRRQMKTILASGWRIRAARRNQAG